MKFRVAVLGVLPFIALAACSNSNNSNGNVIPPVAPAPQVTKATGSFYSQFTGTPRESLDVISAAGRYNPSGDFITMSATMGAPVASGAPNIYVWGFDRGGAAFGVAPFPAEPNIKFNAVAIVTVNADGSYTATANGTPLQTGVVVSGSTITLGFPASLMPSTGFIPAQYTWNLWPRNGLGGAPQAQIASFAPENAMAPLTNAQF